MSAIDPFDPAHFDLVINGTSANDVLSFPMSTLALLLRGRQGNDVLRGGLGDDAAVGGSGADTFVAGQGDDLFDGGSGVDIYDASQLVSTFGPLGSAFTFGFGGRISKGNQGDDVIGVFDLTTLSVTPVEVIIAPLGVTDNLIDLSAQPGQSPDASAIVDLRLSSITLVAETVPGVPPGTVLFSVTAQNFQNVVGTNFGDDLRGSSQANVIDGADGDDVIRGGSGNDSLVGSFGNDTLRGNADQDQLDGGEGFNVLGGGSGADLFILRTTDAGAPDEYDDIDDFEIGLDTLLITGGFSEFFGSDGLDFIDLGGRLALVDRANAIGDLGPFDTIVTFSNLDFDIANIIGVSASTSFNADLIG